jgi:MoaA/NifB/PqqE/SkfB family radical SAM enzyme
MSGKLLRGLPAQLEDERALGQTEIDYLLLSLPCGCNLECKKCFVGGGERKTYLSQEKRTDIVEEAKEMGARVVVIPGEGEPLMEPGIRKMIQYCHSLGMATIVFTNATLLDEEFARFAKDSGVSFVISLDSLKEDVYGFLTGGGDFFHKTVGNIEKLRVIYSDAFSYTGKGEKVVRLAVNAVVTRQNRHEMRHLRDWCGDDMVFICNSLVREGRAVQHWDKLAGTGEEYKEQRKIALEMSETHGPTSACQDGRCAYLFYGLTVGVDGDILVCPDARGTKGVIGNVRETTLKELNRMHRGYLTEFFKRHGYGPCIVRHPEYGRLIEIISPDALQ